MADRSCSLRTMCGQGTTIRRPRIGWPDARTDGRTAIKISRISHLQRSPRTKWTETVDFGANGTTASSRSHTYPLLAVSRCRCPFVGAGVDDLQGFVRRHHGIRLVLQISNVSIRSMCRVMFSYIFVFFLRIRSYKSYPYLQFKSFTSPFTSHQRSI